MKATAPPWLDTQATVTSCRYRFAGPATLALGIPTRKHFVIAFTYHAHGQDFTGEFTSPTYLEQNSTFPIAYNPLNPEQNDRTSGAGPARNPLIPVAIGVSALVLFLWLATARGCN